MDYCSNKTRDILDVHVREALRSGNVTCLTNSHRFDPNVDGITSVPHCDVNV